jgi:hypothetical protein
MLRRIFGPERDGETRGWRKDNEKLYNMYFLLSVIRMTKSRMRWAEHVARMGENRNRI